MRNNSKEEFPEYTNINERTKKSIDLYKKISKEANDKQWDVIFLSGFAFDANVGHITRDHRDIDLMISKDEAEKLAEFLVSEGHDVYSVEKSRGEMLKIDSIESTRSSSAHGDIHYFWNDSGGKATIPLYGKLLQFSTNSKSLYNEMEFLGHKSKFLKPNFLLEEKLGWQNQIGLTGREVENEKVKDKIRNLISLTN